SQCDSIETTRSCYQRSSRRATPLLPAEQYSEDETESCHHPLTRRAGYCFGRSSSLTPKSCRLDSCSYLRRQIPPSLSAGAASSRPSSLSCRHQGATGSRMDCQELPIGLTRFC